MKKIFVSAFVVVLSVCLLFTGTVQVAKADSDLDLTSKSGLLMDYASGQVLFEKDSEKHLPIASMVKMMTVLIALEEYEAGNIELNSLITTTENASSMGGSQVFIDPYVDYTFEDLLKSVIMASANDASVALAEYFNGNEKSFTNRMNKRAKELGMNDTNYVNCTGLPAPEQYSCAKDCAILLKEILKHDIYHNYSSIWMDELTHPSGRKTELVNTNRLIRYFQGCDSGKTGSTSEAGCCLTASAKRGDMRLISVIIGAENSKTRFNESAELLNYGFSNFENRFLVNSDSIFANLKVGKGKIDDVDIYAKESFSAVVKKGDKIAYETVAELPDCVKAPVKAGDAIGKVVVTENGNVIKTIDLIVKEDVKHFSLLDSINRIVEKW